MITAHDTIAAIKGVWLDEEDEADALPVTPPANGVVVVVAADDGCAVSVVVGMEVEVEGDVEVSGVDDESTMSEVEVSTTVEDVV